MNEKEISKQLPDYAFTGTTWNKYDSKKEEVYKAEAKAIKEKYIGADYRIVTGLANTWLGTNNKGIWGNAVYRKVQDYKEDTLQIKLDNIKSREERLKAELAECEQLRQEAIKEDAEIRSLIKKWSYKN